MKLLVVFALVLSCVFSSRATLKNKLRDYNADEPPPGQTEVRLGVYINQMTLTENAMKIIFYIRQLWKDERLAGVDDNTRLYGNRYKDIWRPDTFFRNAITAGRRNNGMTVEQFTKLNSTGHVWHVMTIEGEFGCPQRGPAWANRMCKINFESYGYTYDTVFYSWMDSPVDVDQEIELPNYSLTDTILHDCSQNYTAGRFPCLETRFVFNRSNTCG